VPPYLNHVYYSEREREEEINMSSAIPCGCKGNSYCPLDAAYPCPANLLNSDRPIGGCGCPNKNAAGRPACSDGKCRTWPNNARCKPLGFRAGNF
jgi:hypothetical protein